MSLFQGVIMASDVVCSNWPRLPRVRRGRSADLWARFPKLGGVFCGQPNFVEARLDRPIGRLFERTLPRLLWRDVAHFPVDRLRLRHRRLVGVAAAPLTASVDAALASSAARRFRPRNFDAFSGTFEPARAAIRTASARSWHWKSQ